MKIIILVLSINVDPWKTIEVEGVRKTWASKEIEDVKILYYYGGSLINSLDGDKIFLSEPEGLMNIGYKTISAFNFIFKNFDFDILFRTNVSSYIDIELLKIFVNSVYHKNFFCGPIGNYFSLKFASGSGYFLSKDLVEKVLRIKDKWNHNLIDDVALSQLLATENIFPIPGRRYDIVNNDNIPLDYYHYRCKDINGNRGNDIIRMHQIHNLKMVK